MALASVRRLTLPAIWDRSGESRGEASRDGPRQSDRGAYERSAMRVWSAGFITNRRELLAATGLPPAATDPEILCSLFRRLGAEAARQIEGPFSWVLVEPSAGQLFAGRDRAGTVGLYYAETAGRLLVGNRVRQLRAALPGVSLNLRSLVAQIQGCAPPAGETCLTEVRALEPGAMLIASAAGLRVRRYWRLEPRPILRLPSDAEYADALRELLFRVGEQYRASEPSAVALSSGLDSTAVAAALGATDSAARVTLFTFATPELPASDESAGARAVAEYLGMSHEVLRGDELWPLSESEGIETLEEGPAVNYQELWLELFRLLQQRGVRVAFTGASGDHLFGGTGVLVYPDLLLGGRWLRLGELLRSHRDRSGLPVRRVVHRHLLRPLARACLPYRWALARKRVPWLGEIGRSLLPEALPREEGRWRRLPGRRLRLQGLGDTMLAHNVSLVATLADEHGIELRHPLTDHRLMEFAASLPLDQCLRDGLAKFVLRNSMSGHLPPSILWTPERIYPAALFERGLRHREQAKVRRLISGMRAAELGLVDEPELQRAYERYLEGSGGTVFWHTLTLEAWLRRHA